MRNTGYVDPAPTDEKTTRTRSLGICLGASTLSMVTLEQDAAGSTLAESGLNGKPKVVTHAQYAHGGNPRRVLEAVLREIDTTRFDSIAITGRKFQQFVNLSSISEPEAVEYAYQYARPDGVDCPAVISAGGETFMVYVLDKDGRIANVLTGNKCASGTGEFFLQQLRRMNISLEDITDWTADEKPHHVSGRCSVFCKSDCTHATNKGVPKSQVTAGLCIMMANKILELLKKVKREHVMVAGGTALNRMMVANLRKEIDGLIVPDEAPYFEALGAALWALDKPTRPFPGLSQLFRKEVDTFEALPPLTDFEDQVTFKTIDVDTPRPGDVCILGLDVGSTTTKAVLIRRADRALLASVYLRTNGDPVGASRECYQAILDQVKTAVDPKSISIAGLGVCGSGRQIAGLHALTDGVVNEIIAHAAAAVYFDPDVDTIFEIGGQDAKYTYITNGVASDYAMNEACSAGTGSFLEESAYESLQVAMEDIADIAIKGRRPPNFNDQCAAFIASDIKNAIHEGVAHEDIVAGLVYSICMNYANRVKGNRQVGEKVFMQGGVCYNRAVPLAMAALVGKPIVVPPEPGLMGAFGVALEVMHRIDNGLMAAREFDLEALANRDVRYGKTFTCRGGRDRCDRRCAIAMIELEGKRYPFGGACNRYYNLRHQIDYDVPRLDLVKSRQRAVFETFAAGPKPSDTAGERRCVAFNRSFLVSTYYPFYTTFFAEMGFDTVIPDKPLQEGIDMRSAAFCYPAELAHGFFYSLLTADKAPDYIFLPHFKSIPNVDGGTASQLCPFVQGETFYLQAAFGEHLKRLRQRGTRVLSPLLDLWSGLDAARPALLSIANEMGVGRKIAAAAFERAVTAQTDCEAEMRAAGRKALLELEKDTSRSAVVVFCRPYNGLVEEANMGIPHKLASRGVLVLPLDFLPIEQETDKHHMYWGMGQRILRAARIVQRHPQLFGTYITNFSCGPDSFLIGYFRELMGRKPSLTLELDSHTADAGLETRIEAFLDIVKAYRQLAANKKTREAKPVFVPATTRLNNGQPAVRNSAGRTVLLTDPAVTVLFPSMGDLTSESLAAVFRSKGMHGVAHPPADETVLKLGRANTSCKECLPLILTTGTLLNYVRNRKRNDEILVYFMPTGAGPCRFGQYYVFMEDMVRRMQLPDVALFSLTSENSYAGMGQDVQTRAWWGVLVSDVMEDIRSMLLTNAVDIDDAMSRFADNWNRIIRSLETGVFRELVTQLAAVVQDLRRIALKQDPANVPTIYLAGEIFVRRDGISRQYITENLAKRGFAVTCAPIAEWMRYSDHLVDRGLTDRDMSISGRLAFQTKKWLMTYYERKIKSVLAQSGLFHSRPVDIPEIVRNAAPFVSDNLTGEAVLTVGSSLTEVVTETCGVIAIGPFGCMPNRMSEAILNETMNRKCKLATDPENKALRSVLADTEQLPFLAIESDGSPFPQLINAKLETFCLRAGRLHEKMLACRME